MIVLFDISPNILFLIFFLPDTQVDRPVYLHRYFIVSAAIRPRPAAIPMAGIVTFPEIAAPDGAQRRSGDQGPQAGGHRPRPFEPSPGPGLNPGRHNWLLAAGQSAPASFVHIMFLVAEIKCKMGGSRRPGRQPQALYVPGPAATEPAPGVSTGRKDGRISPKHKSSKNAQLNQKPI